MQSPLISSRIDSQNPQRWDTHFYTAVLPTVAPSRNEVSSEAVEAPSATSDGVETVSADWFTPLAAVQRALLPRDDPKHIILAPPQFYFLAELVPVKRWKDLLDASGRPRARTVIAFEPEITVVPVSSSSGAEDGEASSFATVLPGDPHHSATPSLAPAPSPDAVHRTYIDPPKRGGGPPGGLTIKGVRRKGIAAALGEEWYDMAAGQTFELDSASKSKL